MSNKKSKVLLIVNPCAGRTKSRAGTFDIVNKFSNNDYDFAIHTTTCRGDATNIVKKNYDGKDLVVCCGGDGTLNETINGVMDMPNRVPIGYIPTGTTNDLANTLGIPSDIKKATDLIMSGHTNSYDIGLFNNRCFSYVASFGAFTSASYSTSQKMKNIFGHSAYLLKGAMDWASIKSHHCRIEYDGGVIEDDFMFGSVSNSTSVAGVFRFKTEDVKLNDGYFEILLVKKISLLAVPVILNKVIRQQYDGEQIMFLKTRNFKLTSNEPIAWTLDGEFGGEHKVSNIHVLSRAVDICSPENDLFEKEEIIPDEPVGKDKEVEETLRQRFKTRRAEKVSKEPKAEKQENEPESVGSEQAVEKTEKEPEANKPMEAEEPLRKKLRQKISVKSENTENASDDEKSAETL